MCTSEDYTSNETQCEKMDTFGNVNPVNNQLKK